MNSIRRGVMRIRRGVQKLHLEPTMKEKQHIQDWHICTRCGEYVTWKNRTPSCTCGYPKSAKEIKERKIREETERLVAGANLGGWEC